jgi:hypothetical protein
VPAFSDARVVPSLRPRHHDCDPDPSESPALSVSDPAVGPLATDTFAAWREKDREMIVNSEP